MNTQKKTLVLLVLALLLVALSSASVSANPIECCTVTPGYLKNHPGVWGEGTTAWSKLVIAFKLQGYTPEDVMEWLQQPTRGDKTYTLFRAAFAAKFNVINGCGCEEVYAPLGQARYWLEQEGQGVGDGVKASSGAWKEAEPWYWELDDYNNGKLCACAPACD